MPDGSAHITANATPTESLRSPLKLQSQMAALRPLPRTLTDDEVTFFSAAIDAGATLVPRLLRDYLSGVSCIPFQFEGCSASIWPGDEWAQPYVAAARVKRDAFLARWRNGDLAQVVARINAASAQREAA